MIHTEKSGSVLQSSQSYEQIEKGKTKLGLIINSAFENLESSRELSSEKLVRKWTTSSGEIRLFVDPITKGFSAEVIRNNHVYRVSKEDIIGLPNKGHNNPDLLEKFFRDTGVRIATLQGEGYKIYISHGLKGGMDEPGPSSGGSNEAPAPGRLDRDLTKRLKAIVHETEEHIKANSNVGPAVALVGVTGSGKSTAINHLSGSKVEVIRERGALNGKIRVVEGEEEIARIGHSFVNSETKIAKICRRENAPFAFIDCGGFLETRGAVTEMEVMASMRLTLQNQSNLRLMICIDYNELVITRGQKIAETVKIVLRDFLNNYLTHQTSVMVVLTKPKYLEHEDPERHANTQDGKEIIETILREIMAKSDRDENDRELCELYNFILRSNGDYFAVYNPRNDESKKEILDKLGRMGSIYDTRNAFRLSYSHDTQRQLDGEMVAIAHNGLHLLNQLKSNQEDFKRYKKEKNKFRIKIEKIKKDINNLDKIGKEQMKEEQLQIIAENEERIRNTEREIRQLRQNILKIQGNQTTRLKSQAELVVHGGEMFDPNNNRFRVDVSSIIGKTAFSDWIQKHVDSFVDRVVRPKNVKHTFTYKGHLPLEKVKKSPSDGRYWLNEDFSDDRRIYSVIYNSGEGEQKVAKVKYYVQRGFLPEEVANGAADQQSIMFNETRITQLTLDKTRYELSSSQAREKIKDIDGNFDKLKLLESSQRSLATYLGEVQEKLKGTKAEHKANIQNIKSSKDDFQFVLSYLEISKDDELARKPAVKNFVEKSPELLLDDPTPAPASSSNSGPWSSSRDHAN